jgi:hypothetical protein
MFVNDLFTVKAKYSAAQRENVKIRDTIKDKINSSRTVAVIHADHDREQILSFSSR